MTLFLSMYCTFFVIKLTRAATLSLVYQDNFQRGKITHRYRVIRLWEQSLSLFFKSSGLLPLIAFFDGVNWGRSLNFLKLDN